MGTIVQLNQKLTQSKMKALAATIRATKMFPLVGLADVINRYIDIRLKNEVNWNKTFALVLIIFSGGSITPSELGGRMLRSKENITKMVDVLVREGLVKRSRSKKDRRSVQITLTIDGFNRIQQLLSSVENEEKLIKSMLTPAEDENLSAVVIKLMRKLYTEVRFNTNEQPEIG